MHVKKRMIIVSGVLTALTLGIGGAVGIPSLLAARTDIVRIAEAQATLDERFAMHKVMNKTLADIDAAKKRVGPLSDMAIQENHELDFVTAIESAAEASGVSEKLDLITANQVILSPWEREIPIRISVSGPFTNVMNFLNATERLPYLVLMNGIQLLPLTSGDTGGSVNGTFSATVYWLGTDAPDFVNVQSATLSGATAPVAKNP